MTDAPLAGLRVLDAGDFLAAPFCAMLLADWGADVIKAEPLRGDTSRSVGELICEPDISAIFVSGNRGKRSVALDLRGDAGRELMIRLATECDVVIHNRTAVQAAELGLDYASLQQRRPDIIVGSVTAFGDHGPYAGRGALDPIAQAMAGMMSVTGPVQGPPTRCGVTVVDFGAGLTLAGGVLSALWARERTGHGRAVTTSLLEVGLTFSSSLFPLSSALGGPPPRLGNRSHPLLADQFATKDGFVLLAVWDERRWGVLCEILDIPELTADASLGSNAARLDAYYRVQPVIAEAVSRWSSADLVSTLVGRGIICAQTYDIDQVRADPHVAEIGALYEETRLGGAAFTMVNGPLRANGRPRRAELAPPGLGEHTDEVLGELLSMDAAKRQALRSAGTIR